MKFFVVPGQRIIYIHAQYWFLPLAFHPFVFYDKQYNYTELMKVEVNHPWISTNVSLNNHHLLSIEAIDPGALIMRID